MTSLSAVDVSKEARVTASSQETSLSSDNLSSNGGFHSWFSRGSKTEEKKLRLKLDIFILQVLGLLWIFYSLTGYKQHEYVPNSARNSRVSYAKGFYVANAYVSGMKEELNLQGDEFNFFTTYWTVGYIVGMIPSQIIFTRFRPSIWLPAAELIWAVITFCFAAVKTPQQIYAMRFLIGLCESPFYVGAMTLLGNWYTPKELATRAGIFYSASFAANMFSGYLQAAVYSGLNGSQGLAGWRWLFIMCGIITVPGAIWGFFAVPDSPYDSKAFYLSEQQLAFAKARMVKEKRKAFEGIGLGTFKSVLAKPFVWIFVINYIFFCLDTYPLIFFAIYLKSLKIFTVAQVNTIPTAAYGFGFLATISFGFISDKLQNRTAVALAVTLLNLVSVSLLAAHPSIASVIVGYIFNAGTFVYGPLMITFMAETFSNFADERALILGIAQTMGATFNAWVPLLMFNTGTQAPYFRTGYIVVSIMAAAQAAGVAAMGYLGKKIVREKTEVADLET